MMTLEQLHKEIEEIKVRNKRVEIDKKWETSYTRRSFLIVFTYLTIGLYLQAIRIENPWIHAIVPAVGFYISTLTFPFIKEVWKKYIYKNERK